MTAKGLKQGQGHLKTFILPKRNQCKLSNDSPDHDHSVIKLALSQTVSRKFPPT